MLFDEAVIFTDIHFGMKNNSKSHNDDCERFIDWMIEKAHDRGIKKCLFLGDWHHNRSSINVNTLNYTTRCLDKLNTNFEETIMITGNHDLYYREKRDLHSVPMIDRYDNIRMVNDAILETDGCAFVPWLVGDEWRKVKELKSKFIFGHFELPNFYMNAMVQMPDHGHGLRSEDLTQPERVFSGHFHKRQVSDNIIYPGNCFPHNFSDVWDDKRGITFLKWNGDYEFVDWDDGPKYRVTKLSKLIDEPEKILSTNTYCRVILDIDITYEEANYIKETFGKQYDLREISLIPNKKEEAAHEWQGDGNLKIENVDTIVLTQLSNIESATIKNGLLVDIYNSLGT